MADCVVPTLSVPDLTCISDLPTWAAALVNEIQSGLNHMVGCIEDFEYPQCDICVLKDDLVECPISVQMIDFSGISYDDDAGIGVLPKPESLEGLIFKYGIRTTDKFTNQNGPWADLAVTFDEPFPNSCEYIGITCLEAVGDRNPYPDWEEGCAGGFNLMPVHAPFVRDKTAAGFTAWFLGNDYDCEARIKFMFLAAGT